MLVRYKKCNKVGDIMYLWCRTDSEGYFEFGHDDSDSSAISIARTNYDNITNYIGAVHAMLKTIKEVYPSFYHEIEEAAKKDVKAIKNFPLVEEDEDEFWSKVGWA